MKATDDKQIPRKRGTITRNPELDKIFGGRILFPEKNKLAEEQIRQHGLPRELTVERNTGC